MKIKHDVKPELVASKDKTRHTLSAPYLKGNKLVATDGRMLVEVAVKLDDGDSDGHVTADALKAARKAYKKLPAVPLKANGALALPDGTTFPRPNLGSFPNYEQVIPNDDRKEVVIGINAEMLATLAEAIGACRGAVTLGLAVDANGAVDVKAPIRVRASSNPDVKAVIMPMRA